VGGWGGGSASGLSPFTPPRLDGDVPTPGLARKRRTERGEEERRQDAGGGGGGRCRLETVLTEQRGQKGHTLLYL